MHSVSDWKEAGRLKNITFYNRNSVTQYFINSANGVMSQEKVNIEGVVISSKVICSLFISS
jgi:hypothetical protein